MWLCSEISGRIDQNNPPSWFPQAFHQGIKQLTSISEGQGSFYARVFRSWYFNRGFSKLVKDISLKEKKLHGHLTFGTCHSTLSPLAESSALSVPLYPCLEFETQSLLRLLGEGKGKGGKMSLYACCILPTFHPHVNKVPILWVLADPINIYIKTFSSHSLHKDNGGWVKSHAHVKCSTIFSSWVTIVTVHLTPTIHTSRSRPQCQHPRDEKLTWWPHNQQRIICG